MSPKLIRTTMHSAGKVVRAAMVWAGGGMRVRCWPSLLCLAATLAVPSLETRTLQVPIDHFTFDSRAATFGLRYLISDENCAHHQVKAKTACPILFYAGGEDGIAAFANATGFLWQLSEDLGATLVYAEHRYYGTSLPPSPPSSPFAFLSADQALADFAILANTLAGTSGAAVLAVGGSYGGMLAAWLRAKYPNIFTAAFASSAPVLAFQGAGAVSPDGFYGVVAEDYSCRADIQLAFRDLLGMVRQASRFEDIASQLNLCAVPASVQEATNVIALLQQALTNMAQLDYPYATHFLFDLPANPTAVACNRFRTAGGGLRGLSAAAGIVVRPNASSGCVDADLSEWHAFNPGFIPGPWTFQRCSEIVMPVSVGEDNRLFLPCSALPLNCWSNGTDLAGFCSRKYNVKLDTHSAAAAGGFARLNHGDESVFAAAGRILFSNGALDPWGAAGGISNGSSTPSMPVIFIEHAAHHLDLRSPNATFDPESVVAARNLESHILSKWLQ